MATNTVTVLSKYGCHGYTSDQHFVSPYNVNPFSREGYLFCFVFSSPLCSNSPLKAELVPKTAAKQQQEKKASQKGQFCLTDFLSVFTSTSSQRESKVISPSASEENT